MNHLRASVSGGDSTRPGSNIHSNGLRAVRALLPLAAGYFLSYLFRNVNGVIAPDIMRDLGIGADSLGLLTSVYFLTFAAAQLPVGVMLDRYGPRRVQTLLLICAAAGSALCATGTGFVGLLAGRALIGLGTAGGLVAGLKTSVDWFSRDKLARVNGLFIMCGGLGALAATWPAELALRLSGWRGLAALLAVAAGTTALAIWTVVPDGNVCSAPKSEEIRLLDIIRDPLFRRFAPLSASCFGTVLAVQGLWAGPWLADVDRLSRSAVASDLASMAAILIVAAPLWGAATQQLRGRMPLATALALAAIVMVVAEILIISRVGMPALPLWCVFASFGGITVLSYSVLAEHFPSSAIGRANGALNVLHIGFAFLIQLGIGQVVALWQPVDGLYQTQAYQAGLLLPVAFQVAALIWFAAPYVREKLGWLC